ncbi:Mono-functional DNA-alkylating methyl methanesulfonate N-term/CPSF A subunit region containing protein, putative [Angomonas deanei]|uniref:Mono-functional DNA-alkylating methyl methanesulfonate N-term/CPSF A subunit region containing protein, putative n=1 Tax=Angomonas deanei TaxID=59799 RepID=A0A7G2CDH8_9TRYP|nr:Mono-functional DNA-alkylating methyl methanesulfonate N-term/CPSF A subunit region containing protein, putative [Angomonas deanei]
MSFIAFTNKPASTVSGVAKGKFLGDDNVYVVLNRLNTLSLFLLANDGSDCLKHVRDFPVNGTVKYIRKISLPETYHSPRDILFVFNIKQEVAIVSFFTDKSITESYVVTLFSSPLPSTTQHIPGEVFLCASAECEADVYVAFAACHGKLVVLDVIPALCHSLFTAKKKLRSEQMLTKMFGPTTMNSLRSRANGGDSFLLNGVLDYGEFEVRDIAFRCESTPGSEVRLLVLYADRHGKSHLSGYTLNTRQTGDERNKEAPFFILESGLDGPRSCLRHRSVIQANLESTANMLVASPLGVFVVGSQLITLVLLAGPRKVVYTKEVPTADVVAACLQEDACLLVVLASGALCSVRASDHGKTGFLEDHVLDIKSLPSSVVGPVDSIVSLHADCCLATSRFGDTVAVQLSEFNYTVVVDNCGPVLDMVRITDTPGNSIMVSAGVGKSGSLRLLRSAVSLQDVKKCRFQRKILGICSAGNVVVFVCHGENLFFRIHDGALEQISCDWKGLDEQSPFVTGGGLPDGAVVLVFESFIVQARVHQGILTRVHVVETPPLQLASVRGGAFAFASSGRCLHLYEHQEGKVVKSWKTPHSISALCILDSETVAYADWSARFEVYHVTKESVLLSVSLSYVIRSVCYTREKFFFGTMDGYVVEAARRHPQRLDEVRRCHLTKVPVQLQYLHHSGSLIVCGETPFVLIPHDDRTFELTGFSVSHASCCAEVDEAGTLLAVSGLDNTIHVGHCESKSVINMVSCPTGATVTHVQSVVPWGGVLFSLRMKQRDVLHFLPTSDMEALSLWNSASRGISCLENERCVFLQPFSLDGAASVSVDIAAPKEDAGDFVCLVGTSFTFPDEPHSRSSRISWYACLVEKDRSSLQMVGDQTISGALYCCAVVPGLRRKIVLGVSGCIHTYTYDPGEKGFVSDEVFRVGMTIVKLLPNFATSAEPRPTLFALDTRFNAILIGIDPLEGTTSVVRRSSKLRCLIDGVKAADDTLCVSDDSLNLATLCCGNGGPQGSRAKDRLEETAEFHVGDLVTCVIRGSFAPKVGEAEGPDEDSLMVTSSITRGVAGPCLVYGTSNGSVGSLVPLSPTVFSFCLALEKSLEGIEAQLPNRIFSHSAFRSPLVVGRKKGASGNPSFARCQLAPASDSSRGVCDGDFVQLFCELETRLQRMILDTTAKYIVPWLLSGDVDGGVQSDKRGAEVPCEDDIASCNKRLASHSLPQIPFQTAEVVEFVFCMRRIY